MMQIFTDLNSEEVVDTWEDINDGNIVMPPPIIVDELCEFMRDNFTANDQRNAIFKAKPFIKKHNQNLSYIKTPMTITNVASETGGFESWIIGFDGNCYKATAMLDTGCRANGVIGTNISSNAKIDSDGYGCSYIFVIRKNGRVFVDASISLTTVKAKISYTENRLLGGIRTGCPGTFENVGTDFLVGYKSLKRMRKYGFYPSVGIPSEIKIEIPFGAYAGMKVSLNGIPARTEIDSGLFCPTDMCMSINWVLQNLKETDYTVAERYPTFIGGKIKKMVMKYYSEVQNKTMTIEMEDIEFVAFENCMPDYVTGKTIDCIPGKQFMEKLAKKGIFPSFM